MSETVQAVLDATQANALQEDVKAAIKALAKEREIKVAYRGLVTRVTLADGTTGKAKCDPTDEYNALLGYQIAVARAEIRATQKKVIVLRKRNVRH